MGQEQHFFQSFFGPQQGPQVSQDPEYISHNLVVLEITNNWIFVKDLMKRYRQGKIEKLDQLEQLWYNFLVSKNIDIRLFKNNEDFLNNLWRTS